MTLKELLNEQVVESLKQGYIRYDALSARMQDTQQRQGYPALSNGGGNTRGNTNGEALRLLTWQSTGALHGLPLSSPDPLIDTLLKEVQRTALFIKFHHEQAWSSLVTVVGDLRRTAAGAHQMLPGQATAQRLGSIRAALDTISASAVSIDTFTRHNIVASAHLGQLADGEGCQTKTVALDARYVAAAEAALLGSLRIDPIILGLSDCYELLSLVESDSAAAAASLAGGAPRQQWVAPKEFKRVTRKFWLLPRDVARFKIEVVKHIPVLIYGERQKLTEVSEDALPFTPPNTSARDSEAVTSVYFDSLPDLPSYHDRLRRCDQATAMRVRWYGARDPLNPHQQLFVERKVHREAYTNEFSSKQRAAIEQGDMHAFMEGRLHCDERTEEGALLADVQALLTHLHQKPLLQTSYRRTAFQLSTSNIVRLSLDTDLSMVREGPGSVTPGDWCRDLAAHLPAQGETVHFPYAVVEVKLQDKPPEWLKQLVSGGILLPVPKFSKFLHGTAALYQKFTENVPHWFLPEDSDPTHLTPATWAEMADKSDQYALNAANWLFPQVGDEVPPPPAPRRTTLGLFKGKQQQQQQQVEQVEGTSTWHVYQPEVSSQQCNGNGNGLSSIPRAIEEPPRIRKSSASDDGGGSCSSGRTASPQRATAAAVALLRGGIQVAPVDNRSKFGGSSGSGQGSTPDLHSAGTPSGSERQATGRSSPQLLDHIDHVDHDIETGSVHTDSTVPLSVSQRGRSGLLSANANGNDNGNINNALQACAVVGVTPKNNPMDPKAYAVAQYQPQYLDLKGGDVESGGSDGGGGGGTVRRARSLVRTRVEPKTFFANERTFLQWLNISVLVMFLALSLLSGSSLTGGGSAPGASSTSMTSGCAPGDSQCFASKLSGALIAPVALAFMAYALFMYKKRTIQILRRETVRYDDQRGPVLLVVILISVMLISYVLALVYVF